MHFSIHAHAVQGFSLKQVRSSMVRAMVCAVVCPMFCPVVCPVVCGAMTTACGPTCACASLCLRRSTAASRTIRANDFCPFLKRLYNHKGIAYKYISARITTFYKHFISDSTSYQLFKAGL